MSLKKYSSCLFFLFFSNAWATETGTFDCTTYTGRLSGTDSSTILSYDIVKELTPDNWVDTGIKINLGRTNSNSVIIGRYGSTAGCGILCSMGCVRVSGSGHTNQYATLRTYEQTINGFSFGVGWNGAPQLQMQYQTHIGDGFVETVNSSTSGGVVWENEPNSGYAGFKVYSTSTWYLARSGLAGVTRDRVGAVYFYDGGGTASLYIKIPENLSSGTYTFENIPLIRLFHFIANAAASSVYQNELYAYASITITVPQRCYITTTNTSLDFGNINPNSNTGIIAQKTDTLTTTCYYAPEGTKQTITVSGVTEPNYNEDKSILYYPNLADSLGIVYAIDKTALLCDNNEYKFDTAYLVNSRKFSTKSIVSIDNDIHFGLCKTGNIASYGQMSLPVKVSVNWTWDK